LKSDKIEFSPESEEDSDKESEIPTDELDEIESSDSANPHGFMYAARLDTYKKNKKERLDQ